MDGVILLGIVAIVLLLLIVPLLLLIMFYRLKHTRQQLAAVAEQVAWLTSQAMANHHTHADSGAPARRATARGPDIAAAAASPHPETDGSAADAVDGAGWGIPAGGLWASARRVLGTAVTPAGRPPSPALSSLFSGIFSWFMRGNPLAKLGVALLFFGLAYLLRYSIEQNYLTIEMRLAGAAVISLVLLAVGWRLRLRQRLYALILQGGAVGAFYITVFGACKLYHQLPLAMALVLMLVICAASVALAVLQSSLSLAMLASLGGYLAPLLLSDGSGSHVALFSYYLCISCGILAVSRWQSWRALNLLGFIFTFGIGGLWGYSHYQTAYYLSCQLFLVANLILFGLLSLMFGVKTSFKGQWAVDGTLLFGPPLVGFGYQYIISQHWHFGPAFSALGFGLFYLLGARLAFKRAPVKGRMMSLAALALAAAFATLSIPLALSAQWTAIAWTLEGLGMVWLGITQGQRRFYWSGSLVMLLAACSAVRAFSHGMTLISFTTVFGLLALAALAGGALWHRHTAPASHYARFSLAFLCASVLFWLWTLVGVAERLMPDVSRAAMLFLLLMTLSCWLWLWLASRLPLPRLRHTVWLLWPAAAAALALQLIGRGHPLSAGAWSAVWLVAVASGAWWLRRNESHTAAGSAPVWLPSSISGLLHVSGFWLLSALLVSEAVWRAAGLPWGDTEWQFALVMTALALPVFLVWGLDCRGRWPLRTWRGLYWHYALLPVLPLMALLLAVGNLLDGQTVGWRFVPLINPLEESALFALLMLGWWLRRAWPGGAAMGYLRLLVLVLAVWWLNGALLRILAWYGGLPWSVEGLWRSRLVQTSFALAWTFAALLAMLSARRAGSRTLWFCGVGVLIVTVIKLFLIDGAAGGGLGRAVAFLGVAILMLVIGYFVPLPPRRVTGKEPQ
ncbi:DUF2339 domain-containing protein [Acerihabitans sp.]|uniref:DUF2339 domain-containing protein n=1 Tax=Acerihabitans sp. TaxID=2811394 RepID=UPI002EDAC13F